MKVADIAKPVQTWFSVSAAQLTQTTFVPGTAGHYDDVSAFANDGTAWSNEQTVHIYPPNRALVSPAPYGTSAAFSNGLPATDLSSDIRTEHVPGHDWSYLGCLLSVVVDCLQVTRSGHGMRKHREQATNAL